MNCSTSRRPLRTVRPLLHPTLALGIALAAVVTTGCGGSSSTPGTQGTEPVPGGYTAVTILASSTANAQLAHFDLDLDSLTLTSQSGTTVNLISTPVHAEFIHVNGGAEPLLTASVPQGIYTSAAATVGTALFTYVALDPSTGELANNSYTYGATPDSHVKVGLPGPITITGSNMVLSVDLLVAASALWPPCCFADNGPGTWSITPTFNVVSSALSSSPTNPLNGKESGLKGMVASVSTSGTSFTVTAADGSNCSATPPYHCNYQTVDGPTWRVASSGSTIYQGIDGFPQITTGIPVDLDASVQPDGTLLAIRVAVHDPETTNLTVASGPVLFVSNAVSKLYSFPVEQQGALPWAYYFFGDFGTAVFQISAQLANLQNLPFQVSFNGTNVVPGQNVDVSTHDTLDNPSYFKAATITLMPQTINGAVSALGTEGGFTIYTVTLAPYDLFPALAVQPGQTTLLTNPNTVVVYADSNTQKLNTDPITVGGIARFYGLVFNDNGTLRMDCAQINDGVAE